MDSRLQGLLDSVGVAETRERQRYMRQIQPLLDEYSLLYNAVANRSDETSDMILASQPTPQTINGMVADANTLQDLQNISQAISGHINSITEEMNENDIQVAEEPEQGPPYNYPIYQAFVSPIDPQFYHLDPEGGIFPVYQYGSFLPPNQD